MSYTAAKARYASDSAETVTPQRLLIMLYDRLLQDLAGAEGAMLRGEYEAVGNQIGNAQEIVLELHSTLDLELWPGGAGLAALYLWMFGELTTARLKQDPSILVACRELMQPLRDAWHEAALTNLSAVGPA